MKKILGLDLGTNSIGWALIGENIEKKEILGMGTRIIPMSQEVLGTFDRGISISQTAERTRFRGVRRLRERHLLRRERMHRVLHILGFLPEHYAQSIDFDDSPGKFREEKEPKLAWKEIAPNKHEFIFKSSFEEMVQEFKLSKPELFSLNVKGEERNIPYDWTIYYLRKKALRAKIEEAELAWLLLNFNQKRGYYQLRGEEEEENAGKHVEFHTLKVLEVTADEPQKGKTDIWYNVVLENGYIYRRSSKTPLFDWKDKIKEFIVTTELSDDGKVKTDKEGNEKRSFRAPSDDDWTLLKKKTEADIDKSRKTLGSYIYDTILNNPKQKINGKLVRTIERKYYKLELKSILDKQKEFHLKLQNQELYNACLVELYKNNESHRRGIATKDFTHLFLNDILFYQRPLKSKKSLISNCKYEYETFKDHQTGETKKEPVKCIAKSHPLYQEFRLWKFVRDIKFFEIEKYVDGKLKTDVDVTSEFFKGEEDYLALFDWLNSRKEIKQDTLFASYFKIRKTKGNKNFPNRWNFVEDKEYPCNETRYQILTRLSKVSNIPEGFLSKETELALWHILYSVEDKLEIEKALKTFAFKHDLDESFVEAFKKFPPFKKEYGSYSTKAIRKLLPLMRMGKYWKEDDIDVNTKRRISKIMSGEFDETIRNRVREKAIKLTEISHFKGLPEWLTCYVVYDRHSESSELKKWNTPQDIEIYLKKEFRQHEFRNPIVEQIITETLRTVKDIWRMYGDFSEIHVELGREMKNPADKRKEMTLKISDNENTNLRIKALLAELAEHKDVENVRPYSPNQHEILKIYEEGVLCSGIEIPDDIVKITKASKPSQSDLIRYKLWLEQKYRSPYTGAMIPLGKLFTPDYEIEHIIPQSRYFDDSMSNKVICESAVNKEKDNDLGFEFVKKNEGRIIELNFGKSVKIFTISEYESFVKDHYSKSQTRGKMKKLLMDEITESFIDRQLNDSRYISKVVLSLLSNIVREVTEQETISKNVFPGNGSITSTLKYEWGLSDVWNRIITPRFLRMNELTKTDQFGKWTNKEGKKVFQTDMPLELQKGFNKKRIDHRHHALDALVIACATRSHINYLNNESAKLSAKESRYDLKNKLCFKTKIDVMGNYKWQFIKPWDTFTEDSQKALENIIVSFKQNLRVINKTVNKYHCYKDGEKTIEKQKKGDSWAIRKPLHTPMPYAKKEYEFDVLIIANNIGLWRNIIDKSISQKVDDIIKQFDGKLGLAGKFIKVHPILDKNGNPIFETAFNVKTEKYRKRQSILKLSNRGNGGIKSAKEAIKFINKIADSKLQMDLLDHLEKSNNDLDLAFSIDGIERFNFNRRVPVFKLPIAEKSSLKFTLSSRRNKSKNFYEAETGTNLFFAVYEYENGTRNFETVPLNEVIEHQKLTSGLSKADRKPIQVKSGLGRFLFTLSPNDLVYVPDAEEINNPGIFDLNQLNSEKVMRIYKMESCNKSQCFFTPNNVASLIAPYNSTSKSGEFGSLNKSEKSINDEMIKDICWKLEISRTGEILKVLR